jgi:hypothetical protein
VVDSPIRTFVYTLSPGLGKKLFCFTLLLDNSKYQQTDSVVPTRVKGKVTIAADFDAPLDEFADLAFSNYRVQNIWSEMP